MDNIRSLLGIRRMDKVPNGRIREFCRVVKGVDGSLHWFGYVKRMENDRIAKRVYVGKCAGSHSVGRLCNRWIDTVKDCLKKRGLYVRLTRRMVLVYKGECMRDSAWGMNP